MADKAKFAYGSLANLDNAVAAGRIDEFDLLCLVDDGIARIGWLDRNKQPVLVDTEPRVIAVDSLPETGEAGVIYIVGEIVYIYAGGKFVAISESTDLTALKEHVSVFEEKVTTLEGQASVLEEKIVSLEEKDVAIEEQIADVNAELVSKANAEEVNVKIEQIASDIADATVAANAYADKKFNAAMNMCLHEQYEIVNTPKGTLVDYRDNEIRVMCPADTEWVKQSVGSTGNANMYYMGFKAYAPEGAVSFKEGDRGVIVDEMFTFDDDFAGIDEYGRKYSICWFALASYDESSDKWAYFGKNSSTDKYIGWTYIVEWYDSEGVIIASDNVRVNLSNEDCHFAFEPFYMSGITAEVKKYVDEQIENRIEEITEIPVVEF